MRPRTSLQALAAGALALLPPLLACGGTPPPVVYHRLRPLAAEGAPALDVPVYVAAVRLPGILDRPQILTASGPGGASLDQTHRWGSPLQEEVQAVLIENLAQLLGSPRIRPGGWGNLGGAPLQVRVDVEDLAGQPGGGLLLKGRWTLLGSTGTILASRAFRITEPCPPQAPDALVGAHDRAMAALSREIAQEIRKETSKAGPT